MNYVKIFFRLLFLILLLAPFSGISQLFKDNLEEIVDRQNRMNALQKQRIQKYAEQKKVLKEFSDRNGNNIQLVDVDEFGLPVYFTTLNAAAALTLGLDKLKSGGSLGMNLNGEGITVGVWDESLVKNHAEFDNRILSRQGTKLSAHATHVTGTILASGVQEAARGMAPKATATTWDYNNDEAEMASLAKADETGLLLSNHSYGTVMGFFKDDEGKWAWAGNSAISSLEDYRFGFYSERSKTIDQIAFNAPYYTIVWACGNDRGSTGDGSHPPDGGTTGYDILGPDGVAKNVITVGAVEKVLSYTGPASVVMSNFSSWGPTDDGRIKPDLVGDGVLVYSPAVTDAGDDTYASYSGTSVSAPNVTGGLMLLQQLYRDLQGGKFMKAATLKALAIHTVKEAGLNPGPDYSFGWGLLDAAAAADVLLRQDQQSVVILENSLVNGGNFEWEFTPKANTRVTATLVWTDPAGNPVAPVLDPTNKMLVNDLDIVLTDISNAKIFPWILNPSNPSAAATKGNNSIDNVEKIEFENPTQQKYTLKISHKGQLVNDHQSYSLILTYTPVNAMQTYYWIGDSGNWSDPTKWSFTSGGVPANSIPGINGRVVVDENSFTIPGQTISFDGDGACSSLTWLTKKQSTLALNNNKLTVNGNLIVSSDSLSASTSGSIKLTGPTATQNVLTLGDSDLSNVQLVINGEPGSTWKMNGRGNVGGITLNKGKLLANDVVLKTRILNAESVDEKILDISNASITGVVESVMDSSDLQLITNTNTSIQLANNDVANVAWNNIIFNGSLLSHANATLSGGSFFNNVDVTGTLRIDGNNKFDTFTAAPGTNLTFQSGSIQTMSQNTHLESKPTERITLVAEGTALLNFEGHYKLCFDNLDISGVGVEGDVAISAGVGSTLSNAAKWSSNTCDETLFADFSFVFNCEGSLTKFIDLSEGNIVSWEWNFGDAASGENSSARKDPFHIYSSKSNYNVNLKITDGVTVSEHSKIIEINNNDLPVNNIIASSDLLVSQLISDSYQWYRNGEAIPHQTGRSFNFAGEPGAYFVVINNSFCNQPSSIFLVTDVREQHLDQHFNVYPNPAYESINVTMPQSGLPARVSLFTSQGKTVFSSVVNETDFHIETEKLPAGVYVLEIFSKEIIRKKVVLKSTER